jgi:hypothetical protein
MPGQYSAVYAAWIDYNDDGIFDISVNELDLLQTLVAGSGTSPGVLGCICNIPDCTLACNPPAGTHQLARKSSMYT